jgi:1-acyl-sn-glycerol-3-phosphate acyltransferase
VDIPVRGWTFMHWWVRPVVKVWFNIYHKSVVYSGVEHINWEKPIIFAPSHRNAFSDALCIILPTKHRNNRIIYPLIRADAFGNSSAIDWILTSFHMMPVYRPRDSVNIIQKNEAVFDNCYELLAQKRNLLIHPEGNCIPQKRVRSFKKGLARIAFGAEIKYDFEPDVNIIPVGINYREITAPRKGIHIRYGKPIYVKDFEALYRQNPSRGINELTRMMQQKIKDLTIDIADKKHYSFYDDLLTLKKNSDTSFMNQTKFSIEELQAKQEITRSFQERGEEDVNLIEKLTNKLVYLKDFLSEHRLKLNLPLTKKSSLTDILLKGLSFLILLPLALYGLINNAIPWISINRLATKVQEEQFKSSARMTVGLLLFPLCYVLQTIIIFFLTPRWIWAVIYLFSLPLTGLIALNWKENLQHRIQELRIYLLPENERQKFHELISQIFYSLTT